MWAGSAKGCHSGRRSRGGTWACKRIFGTRLGDLSGGPQDSGKWHGDSVLPGDNPKRLVQRVDIDGQSRTTMDRVVSERVHSRPEQGLGGSRPVQPPNIQVFGLSKALSSAQSSDHPQPLCGGGGKGSDI